MSDEMNISEMLAEQVSRLFKDQVNRQTWLDAENGRPAAVLWAEIERMGMTLAMTTQEQGGAGLSWADCEPMLRLCGIHATPLPVGETVVGGWALSTSGLEVPVGALAISTEAYRLDEFGNLHGHDPQVSWLTQVGHVVLVGERAGVAYVCLVSATAGKRNDVETMDRLPCAQWSLDGVAPEQIALAPAGLGQDALRPYVAVLRSVQMAGALAHVLELCVEYANTRVQFGKPIGKFQAIQHMIAELASQAAAAQVAGQYAVRQLDAGNVFQAAAVAKTLVGKAAGRAAAIAHQVFGAIGVTDEHSLHYYTRRLWQWRSDAGSEHWWAERMGQQVLTNGGAALWSTLTQTCVEKT
jgi:acyl-CoA dehydrogenase